ncbi:MAG: hypothetical protein ACYTF0_03670, partial [Planctomycetota bacterium]|jgi:ABC-type uncharacterized transport system permease subunit
LTDGIAQPVVDENGDGGWLIGVHIAFMVAYIACVVTASGTASLWLLTRRQLKGAQAVALRLPSLPVLERLILRALVSAAALLSGGLATGAVALTKSADMSITHPAMLASIAGMAVLVAVLGAHAANRAGPRALAATCLVLSVLVAATMFSLVMSPIHGS